MTLREKFCAFKIPSTTFYNDIKINSITTKVVLGAKFIFMKIVIIKASPADAEWVDKIKAELGRWNFEVMEYAASAHKVPEMVLEIVQKYNQEEKIIYITVAGRSNGLSGMVAANSIHPVIACPPFSDKTDLLVNIQSTLQMPSDTPVLTILDPKNVAAAVARMSGLADDIMRQKVKDRIKEIKESFK